MLWTCPRCNFKRIRWNPDTWSEAQVGAIVRNRCLGKPSIELDGARGFVFLGGSYAADTQIRCPKCRTRFYPGDSSQNSPASKSSARPIGR